MLVILQIADWLHENRQMSVLYQTDGTSSSAGMVYQHMQGQGK